MVLKISDTTGLYGKATANFNKIAFADLGSARVSRLVSASRRNRLSFDFDFSGEEVMQKSSRSRGRASPACETRDFCFDFHFGEWGEFSNVPSPFPKCIVNRLIITAKRPIGDDDAPQPFH